MNDLYIKLTKLCFDSMRLKILKWSFDNYQYKDKMVKEQNNIYNKYKFYDNYIKCINKMGGRLALRKDGEKLEC